MELTVPADLVPDPLVVVRLDGTVDEANGPARELLGREPEANLVTTLGIDGPQLSTYLRRASRSTGLTPGRLDTRGDVSPVRSWIAWGRRLSAEDARVVLRLEDRDRSSFQHLSRRLDNLHAEVGRRVEVERQLNELVTDSLAKLQRANESLTRYASSVAHDLRSPLVAIRGFAALLPRFDEPEDAELTDAIVRNASRALDMVDGLLEGSVQVADDATVHVGEVATWALEAVGSAARDTGASISVGDLPTVRCNASAMRHALYNLLRNALQHRPTGHQPKVEVRAERLDGVWRICVDDDGAGIPAEAREAVFERGVRLQPDRTEGHGLGLSSCRAALRDSGGDLHVEDSPLGGARLVITVPAAR